jgi:hypothetical protein
LGTKAWEYPRYNAWMETLDLAWVAGLLEGEGSFMRGAPSRPNKVIVSMESTDFDVLGRLADLCGVRVSTLSPRNVDRWKPTGRVRLHGSRAVSLMRAIRPWMGERRREQIDAALASYEVKRSRKMEI